MNYNNLSINEKWVSTKSKEYIVEYGIVHGWFATNPHQVEMLEDLWQNSMAIMGVEIPPSYVADVSETLITFDKDETDDDTSES
jgi:hypothetical protein